MEIEWSPVNAMKAFLQTLHLCKVKNVHEDGVQKNGLDGTKIIEPHGIELLSALAAGNNAKVILDITTSQQQNSVTPSLTLALAVAANQTIGKLICIRPTSHSGYGLDHLTDHVSHASKDGFRNFQMECQFSSYGLDHLMDHVGHASGAIDLRIGDPREIVNDIRHVDFVVIDCTNLDTTSLRVLCEKLDINPKGAIIVANNILCREQGVVIVDSVLKSKKGVKCCVTTLPLGSCGGFQLIVKIKSNLKCQRRSKHKRFFVTFDD